MEPGNTIRLQSHLLLYHIQKAGRPSRRSLSRSCLDQWVVYYEG